MSHAGPEGLRPAPGGHRAPLRRDPDQLSSYAEAAAPRTGTMHRRADRAPRPAGGGTLGRTGGLAGTRIAAAVIQAVTIVVVARALAPADFAVFSILFGALQVAQAFFDGGCTQAVARHHAQRARLVAVLRYGRVLAVAAAVLATAALLVVAVALDDPLVVSLIPLGVWIAAERQTEMTSMFLVVSGRTGTVATAVVARRGLVLVACAGALLVSPGAVTWAFAVASVVGSGIAWLVLARLAQTLVDALAERADDPPAPDGLRGCAAMLFPYWLTGVGLQLRQLDLSVLAAVTGVGVAAAFAPASRLIPPLRIVPTTYAQVLLAQLSREVRALRPRELVIPCAGALVIAGTGALVVGPLLPLVLGPGYADAVVPLQIALLALVPATAASVLTSGVQAIGRSRYAATCAWVSAVVGLGLVAVLGLVAGASGAAAATGVGFALQAAMLAGGVGAHAASTPGSAPSLLSFGRSPLVSVPAPAPGTATPVPPRRTTRSSLLAQYENLGDLVIRREAIAAFADGGDACLLADAGTPRWWAEAVGAPAARVTTATRGAWLAGLVTARRGDVLVHHGGAFPLRRRDAPRELAQLALGTWLAMRGVRIVRLPRSVGGEPSRLTAALHRLVCRRAAVDLWRDHRSRDLVGTGVLAPDLALRGGPRWTPGRDGPRPLLVVSMRGDRPAEAVGALGPVRRIAAAHDLETLVVCQVERDGPVARELADALGCAVLTWVPAESERRETELRAIYGRTAVVVSNRLHVVLLAAQHGAVPVCPERAPNPKVFGACEVAGVPLAGADDVGRLAAEGLGSRRLRMHERLVEAAAVLADALSGRPRPLEVVVSRPRSAPPGGGVTGVPSAPPVTGVASTDRVGR